MKKEEVKQEDEAVQEASVAAALEVEEQEKLEGQEEAEVYLHGLIVCPTDGMLILASIIT